MPNRMSSYSLNKELVVQNVAVDTFLETETIIKEFIFVDTRINEIDPKFHKNAEIVEFDDMQYEIDYYEKHKAWIEECENSYFYSEADDLERY